MYHIPAATAALLYLAYAGPLCAQDNASSDPALSVSGSVAITSDYRFRGISQTDEDMAVQGGLTIAHESGFYAGAWASNLSGWGTFGGANMELDLIAGYRLQLSGRDAVDVGLTWYMYPGGADKTDFAEPFLKLSGTTGPATLTAGVAYAPNQQALGRWYVTGADAAAGSYDAPGAKGDNLYLWGDAVASLKGTPLTAKAHMGYSNGNPGLGPNGSSLAPTGNYWDWSLGLDATWRNLTLSISYVDTDIGRREAAYLQPSFGKDQDGSGSIADGAVLLSLTATL